MPEILWNEYKKQPEAESSKFDAAEIGGKAFMNGTTNLAIENEKKLTTGITSSYHAGVIAIRTTTVTSKVQKKGEKRKSSSGSTSILQEDYVHLSNGTEQVKKAKYSDSSKIHLPVETSLLNLPASSHTGLLHNVHEPSRLENVNEKFINPNKIYQGLLNNVTQNKKKSTLKIRKQLKHITRKDLEDMIIEQFMNKILYDHEMGQQQELCKRLEATLESANKKALKLTKEVARLKDITEKLADEHNKRKSQFIIPVKVKRSVGLQVNESFLKESHSRHIIASKFGQQVSPDEVDESKVNSLSKTTVLPKNINGEIYAQKTTTNCRHQLTSSKSNFNSCESGSEGCSSLAALSSTLPSSSLDCYKRSSDLKFSDSSFKNDVEVIVDNLIVNKASLCVPLPNTPIQKCNGISKILPPRPKLRLQQKNKSIVLSWDLSAAHDTKPIASFQLFSYDEGTKNVTEPSVWKKIGSVKALELPMACTLTQFKGGRAYHFAVRAVDINGTVGPYSVPKVIRMPP